MALAITERGPTMLSNKYDTFRHDVAKHMAPLRNRQIEGDAWDALVGAVASNAALDDPTRLYSRDGFAHVHEIDRDTYQIAAFQINTFAPGVFGDSAVKYCTPILLTIHALSKHRHAQRSLETTPIAIADFYLGRNFGGSKGPLCNRDRFLEYTRKVLQPGTDHQSFGHRIVYQLVNANYICHHIAEALGYAIGALDLHWSHRQSSSFLSAAAHFAESREKLFIEIIDDFSSEKMRCLFEVPHYAKLMEDAQKFREEFDMLLWEVTYRGEVESFYLPVGYQKVAARRRHENVSVVTTQHIVQHLLRSYYRRPNAFVVASTFQTLELLSRGFLARQEGHPEQCAAFLRNMTTCMGYYPERDFDDFWKKKEAAFDAFEDEFSHTMFFRPPVLS